MRARIAQIAFTLTLIAAAVLVAPGRAHSATAHTFPRPTTNRLYAAP